MAKKLKCECGSKKFYRSMNAMDNIVLTCYPPIHVSVYICEKCGKRHEVRKQEYPTAAKSQEVVLDDFSSVVVSKGEIK